MNKCSLVGTLAGVKQRELSDVVSEICVLM